MSENEHPHQAQQHPQAGAAETAADPWTQNPPVANAPPAGENDRAWRLIEKLASAALVEQRRARRWGILFKTLTFLWLFMLMWMFYQAANWSASGVTGERHTAVIDVEGTIAEGSEASADRIIAGLRAAFADDATAGVILRINSPGGSPVQAGRVYDEIMRLREKHSDKAIYAVAADVCASGAYYIAAAAQGIYANKASLVGSIGVRTDSFGFVGAMEKLGIERRLYTAGENKALLDPFIPEKKEDIAYLKSILGEIHAQFISAVKAGRGERLQEDPGLFSGLVWTGAKSVELGLVDGLGDARYVAEELIGAERLLDYTSRKRWLDRVLEVSAGGLFSLPGDTAGLRLR